MMEFEDIEYNAAIKFPNYEAKWSMSSNQSNNPNSELVVRRRADLQVSTKGFIMSLAVIFLSVDRSSSMSFSSITHFCRIIHACKSSLKWKHYMHHLSALSQRISRLFQSREADLPSTQQQEIDRCRQMGKLLNMTHWRDTLSKSTMVGYTMQVRDVLSTPTRGRKHHQLLVKWATLILLLSINGMNPKHEQHRSVMTEKLLYIIIWFSLITFIALVDQNCLSETLLQRWNLCMSPPAILPNHHQLPWPKPCIQCRRSWFLDQK